MKWIITLLTLILLAIVWIGIIKPQIDARKREEAQRRQEAQWQATRAEADRRLKCLNAQHRLQIGKMSRADYEVFRLRHGC